MEEIVICSINFVPRVFNLKKNKIFLPQQLQEQAVGPGYHEQPLLRGQYPQIY